MATWALSRMAALALSHQAGCAPEQGNARTLAIDQQEPPQYQLMSNGRQQQQQQQDQGCLGEGLETMGPVLCGGMLHTVLDTLASYSLKVRAPCLALRPWVAVCGQAPPPLGRQGAGRIMHPPYGCWMLEIWGAVFRRSRKVSAGSRQLVGPVQSAQHASQLRLICVNAHTYR